MKVVLFILLAVSLWAQPIVVSGGKQVTLTAEAQGTQPFLYQWYRNAVKIPGQTEAKLVISDPKATGIYHCVISNSAGETKTPPVRLSNTTQADAAIITITRKQ